MVSVEGRFLMNSLVSNDGLYSMFFTDLELCSNYDVSGSEMTGPLASYQVATVSMSKYCAGRRKQLHNWILFFL